jgi:trehalose 6-phosphate synthase/phosphatase
MSLLIVSLFLPSTVSVKERAPNAFPNQSVAGAIKRRNTKSAPDIESFDLIPNSHGNIGLQNAIASISPEKLSRKWIGTLGSTAKLSTVQMQELVQKLKKVDQFPVLVSDEEIDGHYNQFCKRVCVLFNSSCCGRRFIISF